MQLRTDAERERDEILARLTDTAKRLSEVTTAHARSELYLTSGERWALAAADRANLPL